jgi:hypothetical protein
MNKTITREAAWELLTEFTQPESMRWPSKPACAPIPASKIIY